MMDINQQIWDTCLDEIKQDGRAISWHISQILGIKTAKVNYELKKRVKNGLLKSESSCYSIIYTINNDQ